MDIIREHLMYKNDPLTICMSKLTPQEQYECVRIVLESKTTNISICTHESTSECIMQILKKLPVQFVQCWTQELPILSQEPRK